MISYEIGLTISYETKTFLCCTRKTIFHSSLNNDNNVKDETKQEATIYINEYKITHKKLKLNFTTLFCMLEHE